ncbi:hypothetical protein ACPPVV_08055 [Rhodanobacter sp. Col0626]|uniref:hypothetical protein n=1 Tax=Rhodanobacter sp. Col0626 TaxID=3415679 RepID=UPI003CF14A5C
MSGKFPLEPLCLLRGIRLRGFEAELRSCRERYDQVEGERLAAVESLAQTLRLRSEFAENSWRKLFERNCPTGSAMDRHERHLALLDQGIVEHQAHLVACEQVSDDARLMLDAALAAWRKARSKLDAVGEMKQEWQRSARSQQERLEEQSLEELALRQAPIS